MAIAAGTRLGPYQIESPIGAGGMGEVYRAKDTRLDRIVAVKVLPPHLSGSEELRQRFEREARAISQLSHPHICPLYDVGSEAGVEYLVMEYLEGTTLADRLAKGALPAEQVLQFGAQIADALDRAHRQGIIHRDLKPGNVMLTKAGVKLLDFGLAKHLGPAVEAELSAADLHADPRAAGSPAHRAGDDHGDLPVHVPGAARREGRRRPHGHLRAGLRPLRDGHGPEGVRGQEPREHDRRDPGAGPAPDLLDLADGAPGPGAGGQDLPGEGTG